MERLGCRRAAAAAIGLVAALAGVSVPASGRPASFRYLATLSERPADWVRTDGRHVVFGSGDRLVLAQAGPPFVERLEITLQDAIRGVPLEQGGRLLGNATEHRSASAGRLHYVAAGQAGLLLYRDETQGAQLYSVNVLNNFFSPQQLEIAVGDSVKWNNAAGFHNVQSCFPQQDGCDGQAANEAFSSGPPADPIWSYTHEFQLPGPNPYICQSHAPFMTGHVEVNATTPPGVSDGTDGTPLTVAKLDPAGAALNVAWDTTSCWGATDHQILYGVGGQLPGGLGEALELSGSECAIGNVSPFAWNLPQELLTAGLTWWIVVTTNGQNREGSWGADSLGNERSGPGPFGSSGECGIGAKDLSNPCGQ